jgi:nicotinate-nucleotide adenylyltransferase
VLIVGEDNLGTFHKWKNYEQILSGYEVYAYPRPQATETKFHSHPKVKVIREVPLMEISSTFIRDAIQKKKDVRYMMPESVWEYVREMHFYE